MKNTKCTKAVITLEEIGDKMDVKVQFFPSAPTKGNPGYAATLAMAALQAIRDYNAGVADDSEQHHCPSRNQGEGG